MFARGNKIIVTESSATGGKHPAVGDIGYISHMFLFLVQKFILMEAFFYYYESDKGKNKKRCERKHFIIDLGMSTSFKRKLTYNGLSSSFLTNRYNSICLFPVFYNGIVTKPDIYTLWHRPINVVGKKPLKIPYGHISIIRSPKEDLSDMQAELLCWMKCMLPTLNLVLNYENVFNGFKNTIINYLEDNNYIDQLKKILVPQYNFNGELTYAIKKTFNNDLYFMSKADRKKLITQFNLCRSASDTVLKLTERNTISNIVRPRSNIYRRMSIRLVSFVTSVDEYDSMSYAYSLIDDMDDRKRVARFILSVLLRRIFSNRYSEHSLTEFLHTDILPIQLFPWKESKIGRRIRRVDQIINESQDSSSLNRLFKEDLGF